MRINKFKSARDSSPTIVDAQEVITEICNGEHKGIIETLRKIDRENDEDAYSEAKKLLPAVTFSGTFEPTRTDRNLKDHSGLMCLDFDHLEEDALDALKMVMETNKYVYAYFTSPGGEGLKVLVKTIIPQNGSDHKVIYTALMNESDFADCDVKNSNVSRLCFLSYDPDMFVNTGSHVFGTVNDPKVSLGPRPKLGESNETEKSNIFDPPTKGDRNNHLLRAARVRFNNGQSFADVLVDTNNQNWAAEEPLPEHEVRTIVDQAQKYHGVEDVVKTEEEVEDLDAILKKSLINSKTKVEPPVSIVKYTIKGGMSFEYYNLLTLGNFSLIKGWKGAKKTALTSALISVAMGDDSRGFLTGGLPEDKSHVVYIDTEQYESETKIVYDRIDNDISDSKNFMSFNFREQDYMMRCNLIDRIFERANGSIGLMIIDGISDLAKADNDEDDATRVTQHLMTWTAKYKCHIIAVIHTNKGRDDATGWLGSKVEKKASAVIKVDKDKATKESVVINDKNRHAMEFPDFLIKIQHNKVIFEEKLNDSDNQFS
jgi:hypothetical protein